MARFELKLPKMGESVAEATITSWLKEVGDTVELDEAVLEIATDKVDSEVPSEEEGILVEKLFKVNDVVQVGQVVAIIETSSNTPNKNLEIETESTQNVDYQDTVSIDKVVETIVKAREVLEPVVSTDDRFYSPLVRNIAKEEGVSQEELDALKGTGKDGRVTKNDILDYVANRGNLKLDASIKEVQPAQTPPKAEAVVQADVPQERVVEAKVNNEKVVEVVSSEKEATKTLLTNSGDEIIEMTRMGKIISHHMMESINTSAHVQSFIEADVTNVWKWRAKVKDAFAKREGENLTFTPIFMEVIAKALRDYPLMNISLEGDKIIKKKHINLGMAAALPDGNLIVPVIKNADQLNLVGMTKQVNDLANRARTNKLKPDEIQGGTYTVTNVGSFGSIMGTPIINQPQVGILALGAIRKMPAVIETPEGDFIGIRYKMILSHSYDHRVVNGALGGMFVKAVKDYLEAWDMKREI
ncbi:dihydrolipoamide acetyltransferase family protein [Siansivirga zeaxanthinifaciens]|uniref:Dihydrolipoamide acetyltransferase component of pyruvate dehydrogenase complex n=1 Tax=Siansivirga zeaxanthinifaciens CC-SAMT-1 TaxID=1454006 RepID=A0A0C5WKT0_9FLAO|nr:dihydrolipoamide acetyltransferase family protein [Siansivirga zeaxanthinifaciens]AJR03420.1 diapophytoene dehydrogenase [Siansivirga zeaxanthinifaciens CC-SAMT-1]